jgi:hypothetical protein
VNHIADHPRFAVRKVASNAATTLIMIMLAALASDAFAEQTRLIRRP